LDFGIIVGLATAPGTPYDAFEAARYAMGDTLRYAERMNLVALSPRGDLSSTSFVLAAPGREYLVLQPRDGSAPFSLTLDAGRYDVEWYNVKTRATLPGQPLDVADGAVELTAPFVDPAVAYVRLSS
jgi:hypothetical protein